MKKTAIILGTSRSNGNTAKLSKEVAQRTDAVIFDISDYNILPFDYEHKNKHDDFTSLIKEILTYDTLIFSSPVYWFSPSVQMKLFLDRITDLLYVEKELGRKLRSKTAAVLSTGEYEKPETCFEEIFQHSFKYLGMNYKGMLYCACGFDETGEKTDVGFDLNKDLIRVNAFSDMLNKQ